MIDAIQTVTRYVVASLLAAVLVTVPVGESALAAGTITFADRICDLTSGSGSEADPYQIGDAPALWEIPDCSSSASPIIPVFFRLTNDIDLTGVTDAPTSSPIGYTTSGWVAFSGVVDGGHHGISGLNLVTDQEFDGSVGMFSELFGATFRNLTISGTVNYSDTDPNIVVGGIAGLATAVTFENVSSYLNVIGRNYAGGFIGYGYESLVVTDSQNFGAVQVLGEGVAGGFAGVLEADSFTVSASTNYGQINGYHYAAGFIGYAPSSSAEISDSSNRGDVYAHFDGDPGIAAGFVGEIGGSFSTNGSLNTGSIQGAKYAAGFIARAPSGSASIVDSGNSGYVATARTPGITAGFAAEIGGGFTISNSINSMNISGFTEVGGFIAFSQQGYGVIDQSFNSGDVIAVGYGGSVGGFVGKHRGGFLIHESDNAGGITGLDYVGGFIGSAPLGGGYVQDSSNLGDIYALQDFAGGFLGFVGGDITISGSVNSEAVLGTNHIAGFVGSSGRNFSISESTNSGEISGSNYVAGFVGSALLGGGYLNESLNSGQITASGTPGYAGGFAGAVASDLSIHYSANSVQVTGGDYAGGFVGLAARDVDIEFSSNSGTINAAHVGGFAGEVRRFLTITTSINSGEILNTNVIHAGGFVGLLSESGTVASSMNSGRVTSVNNAGQLGGFIGWVNAELTVSVSVNTGDISNGETSGGFAGGTDANISVLGSKNSGSISQTDYAGGFIGYIELVGTFESSYNSGALDSAFSAGGFAGFAGDSVQIRNSYNSGTSSGDVYSDALIGFMRAGMPLTTTSAYVLVDSAYAETSNIEDMRDASFFTGWDFDNIWGFGECTQNNGLPMLRMVDAYQTFYADKCFVPQAQSQTSPAPTSTPTAPGYSGPIITSPAQAVTPGSLVLVTGVRLSSVISAQLNGAALPIVAVSDGSLTFRIASSTLPGSFDLTLFSSFGSLTVMDHIRVIANDVGIGVGNANTRSDLVGKTKMLPGKAAGKSRLSLDQTERIQTLLAGSNLKRIVCTAIVSSEMTSHQRIQARKLAASACEVVSEELPGSKVWYQSKLTRHRIYAGKIALTFKG